MRRPLRDLPVPLVLLLAIAIPSPTTGQTLADAPSVVLKGVPFDLAVASEGSPSPIEVRNAAGRVLATVSSTGEETVTIRGLVVTERAQLPLEVRVGTTALELDPTLTSGWFSLMPPLLAIALALIFREVITALFAGVWLGALAVAGFNPVAGTWRVVDTFMVPALADTDGGHAQIVIFSLLLGAMVGIISRNGGTMGIVEAVTPFARTARRGKVATWLAGLAIFFDDYANTLIVGNTMRPITDRLKISREKLAYIVDSTAAPVAAIVPISTWVGYEISLIGDGLRIAAEQQAANPALAQELLAASPFTVFVSSIPYLFYPLLALAFVFLTSAMNRDLGPMAEAERRAAKGEGLFRPGAQLATDTSGHVMDAKEGVRHRWWNAALPVITVILVVLGGLYTDGASKAPVGSGLMDIFGAADPYVTLLWGSLAGCLVGFVLSVGQRLLTIPEAVDAAMGGVKAMVVAIGILILAWSLGSVTQEVGTAQYLAQLLEGNVAIRLMPVIVFITAAAMAFATGTSWTTMAILIPLVIPLTVSLGGASGFGTDYSILLGSISSVLAGAIFGDHCSPISDTTVLSSTAAACDHVDHVRTQLPYALLVAVLGMLLGDIGTAYGLPNAVALLGGIGVLYLVLRLWGVPSGSVTADAEAEGVEA